MRRSGRGGNSPADESTRISALTRGRITPVKGCKAFSRLHDAVQNVASEGAGIFSPVGGMRQVSFWLLFVEA